MEAPAATITEPATSSAERPGTLQLLLTPWTLAVVVVGLVIRLWVLYTPLGQLIADEAYTGLQSAAVLDGRFPVVIDGLTYTAPIDSYLLAPVTAVFGQDVLLLKLFPSLAWAISAVLVVAITRRLASDRAALLAGALLWLAPGALAVIATRAYQSYSSGMAMVTATTLAVVALVDHARRGDRLTPTAWRSALVGGLAGFTFYMHPMYLAVLVPMLLVPGWRFRTRVREWWAPAVIAAVLANGPFLFWNAKNGWPSLEQPAEAVDGPVDRLLRFGHTLVPRAYGLRSVDGGWLFGYPLTMLLLVGLVSLAGYGAVRLWRSDATLSAIVVLPLVLSWFILAGYTNTTVVFDGRYAIVGFPFVVIAIAVGASHLAPDRPFAMVAVVAVWVLVFSVPHLVHDGGTDLADPNENFREVVRLLRERGVERVSGTYWWVLPVELLSDQEIRASVAGHPYVVLLPKTQRLVESSPPESVAFVLENAFDTPLLLRLPVEQYERIELDGVVVYVPPAP